MLKECPCILHMMVEYMFVATLGLLYVFQGNLYGLAAKFVFFVAVYPWMSPLALKIVLHYNWVLFWHVRIHVGFINMEYMF